MEYREDLAAVLLAGLPQAERDHVVGPSTGWMLIGCAASAPAVRRTPTPRPVTRPTTSPALTTSGNRGSARAIKKVTNSD